MKSLKNSTRFVFICAVFLSSLLSNGMGHESAESDAAAEYHAQYDQDYYNSLAGKINQHLNFLVHSTRNLKIMGIIL